MEGIIALDSENYGVGGVNMKIPGEKMIKSSKIGSAQRKRLADVSNLQQQPTVQKQDTRQQSSLLFANEYADKLQKENMTLMKLLAERNHIIEIGGIEFQKLRTNFQKLQQQNLQLAQANSQMLAELNSGKDRLKVIQHELGCKNGLLMSRKLDLEGSKKAATCQIGEVGTAECDEAEESVHVNKDNRLCRTNRRQQSKRESFGHSVVQPEVQKVEGKRPCLRRRSARFKTEEPVATEDLCETENSKFTAASQCKEIVHESVSITISSAEREDDGNATHKSEAQECRRSSVGRPLRRAVEKIQSYKEIPINVKMRRQLSADVSELQVAQSSLNSNFDEAALRFYL